MNLCAARIRAFSAAALAAAMVATGEPGQCPVASLWQPAHSQPLCQAPAFSEAPVLVQRRHELRLRHGGAASSGTAGALSLEENSGRLAVDRAAAGKLTVLCWNVLYTNFGYGKEGKRNWIADVMTNEMKADVAGLQECMQEDALQAALGDRMKKAPGTDTFNCIFYKPGIVEFGGVSGRRYLGDAVRDNYSQRFVSYAKLFHGGKEFWVFSTHWCLDGPCAGAAGGERHELSAKFILNLRKELGAEGLPTIITADANSHMDGWDNDDGVQWFLNNGFVIAGKGPMAGGIDYTFISKGHWDIGEHIVGPTQPSDHPSFTVELTLLGASGDQSSGGDNTPPDESSSEDNYRKVEGIGSWGGTCECPSGQVYNVGDIWDGCANGPASLACEGGKPGECVKVHDSSRRGMKVTCAPAPSTPAPTPTPTPEPTPAPVPEPTARPNDDHYRKAEPPMKVGAFGGWCTCPSGERYNVGDRWDSCANGPASLACEGGTAGECEKKEVSARRGMMVTCGKAETTATTTETTTPPPTTRTMTTTEKAVITTSEAPAQDHYRKVDKVGSWGGFCTCPNGKSYNVGDKNDGCKDGSQSLACEGGVPGECMKKADVARKGMMVTCAPAPDSDAEATQDDYRHVEKVGSWGGICTCPNGKTYNVGDRNDGCKNGSASLACDGGIPGRCNKQSDPARKGMMVTCAAPTDGQTLPVDNYRQVPHIGSWGGICTCPNGKTYNVGDKNDGCKDGKSSLACEGGTPGACMKVADPSRAGMMVTCG